MTAIPTPAAVEPMLDIDPARLAEIREEYTGYKWPFDPLRVEVGA